MAHESGSNNISGIESWRLINISSSVSAKTLSGMKAASSSKYWHGSVEMAWASGRKYEKLMAKKSISQ
jgi:hypothetical protein